MSKAKNNFWKGLAVALAIDAIDLIMLPIFNEGADIVQALLAWFYFKDKTYLLGVAELGLPAGFDILPTTTLIYLAKWKKML